MSELLIMIVIFLAGFILWRVWFISKGILRPLDSLKMAIYQLLEMGYENGVLILTAKGTKKFIQFGKYIKNRNEYGIELSFPKADWSKECFLQLKKYCETEKIKYRITKGIEHPMEFLDIDFKKDIDEAYKITRYISEDIFGLPKNYQYHVMLNNARFPTLEEREAMIKKLKEKNN